MAHGSDAFALTSPPTPTTGQSRNPTPLPSRKRARSRVGNFPEFFEDSSLERVIRAWPALRNQKCIKEAASEIFCREYTHRVNDEAFYTITDLFDQMSKAAIFVNFTGKKGSEWLAKRSKEDVQGMEDE